MSTRLTNRNVVSPQLVFQYFCFSLFSLSGWHLVHWEPTQDVVLLSLYVLCLWFNSHCPLFSQFLVKESGKQTTLTAALTLPVPDTLLCHGEEMLSNPHDVTLVLGALQFVSLEHLIMEVYHTTFESIHKALFAVIQCLPQVSGLGSIHVTSCIFLCFYPILGHKNGSFWGCF